MFTKESADNLRSAKQKDEVAFTKQQAEFIQNVAMYAARWGMFQQYTMSSQKLWHQTAVGLFKKNFPDEKVPKELPNQLQELTDKDSGKTFEEIITMQMIDDWANTEATQDANLLLENMAGSTPAKEFIETIRENVEHLKVPLINGMRVRNELERFSDGS